MALAIRYSDDEPGSPWSWILYLDAKATRERQAALEAIFSGELGGDATTHFPWAWKASERLAVRSVAIDVAHTRRPHWLMIRDHEGEELITDWRSVSDGALAFSYRGVCGYTTSFHYAG